MQNELPHRIIYKGNWSFPVYKQFVLDPAFTIGEKLLYIALRSYCAPDGETAFPSVKTLAAGLAVGPDSVRNYAAKLEKKGLVTREQKMDKTESGSFRFSHTVWTVLDPREVNRINGAARYGDSPSRETPVTGETGTNVRVQSKTNKKPIEENGALPPEALFWNKHCRALPGVLKCGESRMRHLRKRRADPFWVANFEAAVIKATDSDFCNGNSDRGWRANFDWLIGQSDTVAKIMEGKYDNREPVAVSRFDKPRNDYEREVPPDERY